MCREVQVMAALRELARRAQPPPERPGVRPARPR